MVSTPATSSSTRETRAARMGLGRLLDYHDNEAIREGVLEELNNDKHTAIRRDGVYILISKCMQFGVAMACLVKWRRKSL